MSSRSRQPVIEALQAVLDPEVGINVIDLGLVYWIEWQDHDLRVLMTMTSAACPLGAYLQESAERAIRARIPDTSSIQFEMVWQPAWEPAMMSAEARQQMGWRG